ncbi:MAG: hypothetical protein VKO21_11955 [Candidatus Sericytochromatia bacterium]|nr:hypothetical protein [Candidatus Sericytochromatia bacterium]
MMHTEPDSSDDLERMNTPFSQRLGEVPLLTLRALAAGIACGSALGLGVVLYLLAGETGPDAWRGAVPGVFTFWVYAPMWLPIAVALSAKTRSTILAAAASALCSDLTLLMPVLELTAPSRDAQGGFLVLVAPLPALLLALVVFPLVRRWARSKFVDGRVIR